VPAFGGSSQTVFGGQGAGGFLTRLVAITVAVFLLTSLALAYISSHRVQATIMESPDQTAAPTEAPAAPTEGEQPATAAPTGGEQTATPAQSAAGEESAAPGERGSEPAAPDAAGSQSGENP